MAAREKSGEKARLVGLPTPEISELSPSSGPLAGGNSVTISGSGFTDATSVSFSGTPASFTVASAHRIEAVAPGGIQPGPLTVTVTTPGGTSSGSPYFSVAAPTVTGVDQNHGQTGGGNEVIITGTGFAVADAVSFGPNPAAFTRVTDNQINAIAPQGSGTVNITVTGPGGTSVTSAASQYTYLGAPALTSAEPEQGATSGGTSVILNGHGLTSATDVFFGATAARFVVLSDNLIVAEAQPAAAGPVPVTVTSPGGTSRDVTFTYVAPPGM